MFELSHLRAFVAVATELNFRRAAERLHMSQPPLSRHIKSLESELRVPLFERTTRTVKLTNAGRTFLLEAQDILKRAEAAALTVRQAQSGQRGTLTVGFIPVSAFGVVPPLLKAISETTEQVSLILHEMLTIEQVEALNAGRIQLGLIRRPRDGSQLETRCIVRESFTLAMPSDHRLSAKSAVTIEDLEGENFIMYSPGDGWYGFEILSPMFTYAGVTPRAVQQLGQTHTIHAMVSAGLGCALVPQLSTVIGLPNVTFRDIELPYPAYAELYLAWRKGNEDPLLCEVISAIQTKAADLSPQSLMPNSVSIDSD